MKQFFLIAIYILLTSHIYSQKKNDSILPPPPPKVSENLRDDIMINENLIKEPVLIDKPALNNKQKKILELIRLIDTKSTMVNLVNSVVDQQQKQNPQIAVDFWIDLKRNIDMKRFEELLIPIYEAYYSEKEIEDIFKFFSTPTGKKYAQSGAFMYQAGTKIGQVWWQEIYDKTMKEFKSKQLDLK